MRDLVPAPGKTSCDGAAKIAERRARLWSLQRERERAFDRKDHDALHPGPHSTGK